MTAIQHWQELSTISTGPLLRPVLNNNQPADRPLHPDSTNTIVQAAIRRGGIIPDGYSAHSLRAGFVTYAASERAIAHQTRHRS